MSAEPVVPGTKPWPFSGEFPEMSADELLLRKLLWLRHGCPPHTLYGDDGEMQCGQCMLDFRRMDVRDIEARFFELGLANAARIVAAEARPALPAPPFNERYTPAMRDLALSCLTGLYAEHPGELEGEQKTAIERYIAYEGLGPPNFAQMRDDFLSQETVVTTEHKNGFAHLDATPLARDYLNAFVGFLTRRFSEYVRPALPAPEPPLLRQNRDGEEGEPCHDDRSPSTRGWGDANPQSGRREQAQRTDVAQNATGKPPSGESLETESSASASAATVATSGFSSCGDDAALPAEHAPPDPSTKAHIAAAKECDRQGIRISDHYDKLDAVLRAAYAVDFGGSRPALAGSPELTDEQLLAAYVAGCNAESELVDAELSPQNIRKGIAAAMRGAVGGAAGSPE